MFRWQTFSHSVSTVVQSFRGLGGGNNLVATFIKITRPTCQRIPNRSVRINEWVKTDHKLQMNCSSLRKQQPLEVQDFKKNEMIN